MAEPVVAAAAAAAAAAGAILSQQRCLRRAVVVGSGNRAFFLEQAGIMRLGWGVEESGDGSGRHEGLVRR